MKKEILLSVILFLWVVQGPCQTIQFAGHLVYQAPTRIFFVTAADLDNDGDQDILFAQPESDTLKWYENQGAGTFILREIGAFSQAFSVCVIDFDADGDNDIIASSYTPAKVVMFENDGNQAFTYNLLSEAIPHPLTIAARDVDMDGDCDIACATQDANKGMMLLRNDGNMVFTPMDLSNQPYSSTWTMISDFDNDGDWDVLGNNFNTPGGVLLYEQTSPLVFTEHLVPFPGTHGFTAADIDGDGDMDLAAVSCGSQLAWFRNDGNYAFTEFPLANNLACAVSVVAGDLNLDQSTDLVASAWSSDKVALWANNGNEEFTMQLVSDSLARPNSVFVADLNNDSLPDIISCGYSGTMIWWENMGHGVGMNEVSVQDCPDISFQSATRCLSISLKTAGSATATLFNIQGVPVLPPVTFAGSVGISCDTLTPGLYFVRMKFADKTITRKILISR